MQNDQDPEEWVLLLRDVTQEHEIQRRIQQQERLAAVGQLAAGIAHDFNNVMSTIVLYAQMAARSPNLSSRDRERMDIIDGQARHASRLIQQILDFSRRGVLERRSLDLLPLVKEHVQILKRTLPENIHVELAYEENKYVVNADPTRIQQVLMNLAVNARDAMPEGGKLCMTLALLNVEASKFAPLPEMPPGVWVALTVSDTGTGIPLDILPRIYDPFFTTKAPGKGSGLGLSQVHGIVMQHMGHIDVQSEVGTGTTFCIYLPALLAQDSEALSSVPESMAKGAGETLLVVEDNAATREALIEGLEILNYHVIAAKNGREALAVLEQQYEDITLVLSDVVMPDMGGIALLRALRARVLDIGVILMTGHSFERELKDLWNLGMVAWLPKPISLARLAEVVDHALEKG
jgi:nitrogen-specific signal transduction histidine kinase/ActR/RegA family two-component response regulator